MKISSQNKIILVKKPDGAIVRSDLCTAIDILRQVELLRGTWMMKSKLEPRLEKHFDLLVSRYPALSSCKQNIIDAFLILQDCYKKGGKLLTAGNGGSAADAEHIVGELMKGFVMSRRMGAEEKQAFSAALGDKADYLTKNLQGALPSVSLIGESSLSTAYANDEAPDLAFAQQLYGLGCKGDAFLAISTSGNSANILYAAQVARVKGIKVIGLTGRDGGKLKALCDVCIIAPAKETYQIQEFHLPIYHALCLALEDAFFGE